MLLEKVADIWPNTRLRLSELASSNTQSDQQGQVPNSNKLYLHQYKNTGQIYMHKDKQLILSTMSAASQDPTHEPYRNIIMNKKEKLDSF